MIFLYAGIGFAMMTTVVAIFETSMTINKRQFVNKSKVIDPEIRLLQKQNDKLFLRMLDDANGISLGSGNEICQNIKNGFVNELDPNYSTFSKYSILNSYSTAIPSYSLHSRLKNSCQLIKDSHRIIIVPSSIQSNKFNYYSCIIDIDDKCSFEMLN
tara:strand:- start:1835 stop:2305 length:471 start_codon:yes stop_codon:yes gene_type:complete